MDIVYLADIVMFLESEDESKEEAIFSNGLKKIKLVISKNRYNSPQVLSFVFDGKNSNFEPTQG